VTIAGTTRSYLEVPLETHIEVEQFLYHEARLLDDRRYDDWLELFTDDVRYWMPARYNTLSRQADLAIGGPDDISNFDEDHESLRQRVVRLNTGMAWSEDPPSRARHLVTNVWVRPSDEPESFDVQSYFFTYRTRAETEQDIWVGRRDDVLRVTLGGFKIARRTILLDQATLLAKNLSVFF
jgi:3-phenylpropionate/cinnamic acid dioxygenase small subunit